MGELLPGSSVDVSVNAVVGIIAVSWRSVAGLGAYPVPRDQYAMEIVRCKASARASIYIYGKWHGSDHTVGRWAVCGFGRISVTFLSTIARRGNG